MAGRARHSVRAGLGSRAYDGAHGVTRPTFPAVIEAFLGGTVMRSGAWISFLLRRGRCGFLPLPNRQGAAVAQLARKICGALGARFAETRPERVSIHFVYPKLGF